MKFLVLFAIIGFAAAQVAEEGTCSKNVKECCEDNKNKCGTDCSALIQDEASRYNDFIKLTNDHLIRSYEYLFMASQFGTYSKDRPGFEKVLHGLSDAAWGKANEMIGETAKRGAVHFFNVTNTGNVVLEDFDEMQVLAKSVEIEKSLLKQANSVHRHHSHATLSDDKSQGYDAGLAHYIEEDIIEGKTETLRNLVGHVNDLKKMWMGENDKTYALSLYLFDQHLQK